MHWFFNNFSRFEIFQDFQRNWSVTLAFTFALFKKTGKMLAIFNLSRKPPDIKKILKITDRLFATQSSTNLIILIGMLLGPVALLLLKSNIVFMISFFVHGLMKINSLHEFFKK